MRLPQETAYLFPTPDAPRPYTRRVPLSYSPFLHSAPLRLSNEGGLSARGKSSPFIIIFSLRMKENKNVFRSSGKLRVCALLDSGRV